MEEERERERLYVSPGWRRKWRLFAVNELSIVHRPIGEEDSRNNSHTVITISMNVKRVFVRVLIKQFSLDTYKTVENLN